MTDQEQIAALQAEYTTLREQLVAALADVRDLQARLAKGSHNSRKPPSSDGLKRQLPRTRSLRRQSGKKPGENVGHPGETLHLVTEPDAISEHRPTVCVACQAPLAVGEGGAEVVTRERRQVQHLPPIQLYVTEHQALRVRCPAGHRRRVSSRGAQPGAVWAAAAQPGGLSGGATIVPDARACDLLHDMCGEQLSVGKLVEWFQHSADTLKPVEEELKAAGDSPGRI
jgi:transposase